MTRKALDPNLASILDSIRATVGGEPAPQSGQEPTPQSGPQSAVELLEPAPAGADDDAADAMPEAARQKGRKAAPAQAPGPVQAAQGPSAAALPGSAGSRTVEEFLAELIRPQLDAWLKANLPELIQKMAADEIARLTGRR